MIRHSDSKQFLNDAAYDLNSMSADLVHNWVFDKELTAGQSRGLSDRGVISLDISYRHVSHEFIENVAYRHGLARATAWGGFPLARKVKAAKSLQREGNLGVLLLDGIRIS